MALSTIWRAIDRLQLTVKQTVHAADQGRPDVVRARDAWQTTMPALPAARLVLLDESGLTTDLLQPYGRSRRGQRLVDHAPFGHWDAHTIVAAVRFLPPYSPDFNPIELAFAKLKAFLRKVRPGTLDQVCQLVAAALTLYTPDECANFVRHCGHAAATGR